MDIGTVHTISTASLILLLILVVVRCRCLGFIASYVVRLGRFCQPGRSLVCAGFRSWLGCSRLPRWS